MARKNKQDRPLKFFHFRSEQGKGSVTIGYEVNLETKTVTFTVAHCAPHDNFCRRIGRDICQGRFRKPQKNPPQTFTFKEYDDIKKHFIDNFHPDNVVVVEDGEPHNMGRNAANPTPVTHIYPGLDY